MPIDAADRDALRAQATAKRAEAKSKAEAAKRNARDAKFLAKNPHPTYSAMPQPTGDAEADSVADLDAVQAGFRSRAKGDADRKRLATDSEFWACLCFQTRAQKEAFLQAINLLQLGDKYIDGVDAARLLGITLPDERPPYHDVTKVDPVWASLAK